MLVVVIMPAMEYEERCKFCSGLLEPCDAMTCQSSQQNWELELEAADDGMTAEGREQSVGWNIESCRGDRSRAHQREEQMGRQK